MALVVVHSIVSEGEDGQYPLHYLGNSYFVYGFYVQMNMISHNAKIAEFEFIFLFGLRNNIQKHHFKFFILEDHFLAIYPGTSMIRGSLYYYSWFSHFNEQHEIFMPSCK